MATLSLKPTQRFAPADWFASNDFISTNAERQRVASHQIRQEARELVNGKLLYTGTYKNKAIFFFLIYKALILCLSKLGDKEMLCIYLCTFL